MIRSGTADIQDYQQRVAAGKRVEALILEALQKQGLKLESPTSHDDVSSKIDSWLIDKVGGRHALQVKYRESGDDILFEITRDLKTGQAGRDLICKSEYYLVVDRRGTGRLYFTKPIKELAQKLLEMVKKDLSVNPIKRTWDGDGWQIKVTNDRASGTEKILAFFNPLKLDMIHEWRNLI
jgi:hypothetical protein